MLPVWITNVFCEPDTRNGKTDTQSNDSLTFTHLLNICNNRKQAAVRKQLLWLYKTKYGLFHKPVIPF
jgi:hypothetical protein